MKKPNIKPPPWSVSKYKPTSVLSGERDVVAENLSEKDAETISAVPEMIGALIEAHLLIKQLIESGIGDTVSVHHTKDQLEEALEKAGVEL